MLVAEKNMTKNELIKNLSKLYAAIVTNILAKNLIQLIPAGKTYPL